MCSFARAPVATAPAFVPALPASVSSVARLRAALEDADPLARLRELRQQLESEPAPPVLTCVELGHDEWRNRCRRCGRLCDVRRDKRWWRLFVVFWGTLGAEMERARLWWAAWAKAWRDVGELAARAAVPEPSRFSLLEVD